MMGPEFNPKPSDFKPSAYYTLTYCVLQASDATYGIKILMKVI